MVGREVLGHEKGVLHEARVARFTHCVLRALAALHDAGLHHGDVRLENILIDGDWCALGDFGCTGPAVAGPYKPVYHQCAIPAHRCGGADFDSRTADIWSVGQVALVLCGGGVVATSPALASFVSATQTAGMTVHALLCHPWVTTHVPVPLPEQCTPVYTPTLTPWALPPYSPTAVGGSTSTSPPSAFHGVPPSPALFTLPPPVMLESPASTVPFGGPLPPLDDDLLDTTDLDAYLFY